ncbi:MULTISPECIES: NapC/NirT family cytochrome c [unclassified Wenzhouxiangella]|uniref:NapC/NirT family cytochrome c n=1 Tax=unclassified Wenzhouxiangella TaxID=2613841 RepID=UPI000E328188|nr:MULTISPECIES: NapC/NirT family cytochrome c [unclassified Wenzhouxiangella]RFF28052.1 Denitrification system component NirT [Wenzhouxiangella sp. 15181]RFP68638.1 Denitrification system component NirT [Wenzhouxiangella sp. 15190]
MPDNENNDRPGIFRRTWRAFSSPSSRYAFGTLLIGGIIIGIIAWSGFNSVIAYTSTNEFCSTACHEMESFVYPDYTESHHFSNRSGVRAKCKDCHIPKAFFPKMATKIRAGLVEVPGHLMGKIDTQEKFDAHKLEMAERVWARLEESDSRECRSCHSYEAMSEDLQDRQAQRRHSAEYREATGRTCINCHKGVAHELPEDM